MHGFAHARQGVGKFISFMKNKLFQKGGKISIKKLIILVIIAAFICVIALLASHMVDRYLDEFSPAETEEITDEINRAKHFISDWYADISDTDSGSCTIYLNELRFANGRYTLTFAGGNRVRAVSPRGERFFKFEYIDNVEFFEIDGKIKCRLYYGRTGEYTFTV